MTRTDISTTRANNHSIILSIYNAVFGLIRQYTELSVKNKTAKDDVWWPFLKASYLDICTCKLSFEVEYALYIELTRAMLDGFCAYMKKTRKGIVLPIHIPIAGIFPSFRVLSHTDF